MKKIQKYFLFAFVLVTISIIIASCYKLDEEPAPEPIKYRSIINTERDILKDSTIYSLPGEVIVIHLEHQNTPPNSIQPGTDTDGIGRDIVPFTIKDTANISFRIDTTTYTIEMYEKESGVKVLTLNKDIPQRIRRYAPGKYLIHLTSLLNYDDDTLNFQLIFIQPDVSVSKSSVSDKDNEIFWFIQSRVQICKECNMRNADFSDMDFSLAQLNNSDLSNAFLIGAMLPLADLSGTDLTGTNLSNAFLPHSSIYNSLLERSILNDADLTGVDMQLADFTNASLRNASAKGANFCNTIRIGWDITGLVIDSTTLCLP